MIRRACREATCWSLEALELEANGAPEMACVVAELTASAWRHVAECAAEGNHCDADSVPVHVAYAVRAYLEAV